MNKLRFLKLIPKTRNQGFTLIEVMIASALLLMILAVLVNSIFNFTRTGNQMLDQTALEEKLRNALNRLESEALEASEVVYSSGSYITGNNTLILAVPIYNEDGFLIVKSNTGDPLQDGRPVTDTLILNVVEDTTAPQKLSLKRNSAVNPRKLTLTLIPHAKSNRQAINNQVIAKDLMPADAGNDNKYKFPTSFGQAGSAEGTLTASPVFQYYTIDGNVSAAAADGVEEITQIKVTLWGEINTSQRLITARKEVDVRLRNWMDPDAVVTPTPTP